MDEEGDTALEEALMRQKRPERPERPIAVEDARREFEKLLTSALVQDGLSEPEARVEAMNTVAWYERKVIDDALSRAVDGKFRA